MRPTFRMATFAGVLMSVFGSTSPASANGLEGFLNGQICFGDRNVRGCIRLGTGGNYGHDDQDYGTRNGRRARRPILGHVPKGEDCRYRYPQTEATGATGNGLIRCYGPFQY